MLYHDNFRFKPHQISDTQLSNFCSVQGGYTNEQKKILTNLLKVIFITCCKCTADTLSLKQEHNLPSSASGSMKIRVSFWAPICPPMTSVKTTLKLSSNSYRESSMSVTLHSLSFSWGPNLMILRWSKGRLKKSDPDRIFPGGVPVAVPS